MVVKTKPWYNPREFIDKRIWKVEDDGSIKIVVWPAKNISFSPKHGKDKSVRCSTKALFHASNIVNPNSSLRQCTVTLTQLIEGHSPSFGSAAAATDELLRTIGHLCEDLRQDMMVDKAHLADFKDMLENSDVEHKYTQEENSMLHAGSALYKKLNAQHLQLTSVLKTSHPIVFGRCGLIRDGQRQHFGAYNSTVIDADLNSCLAYALHFGSRERVGSTEYSLLTKVEKTLTNHSSLVTTKPKAGLLKNILWLSKATWKKNLKSKTAVLLMEDHDEIESSISTNHQPLRLKVFMLLKKLPNREGQVEQTWLTLHSQVELVNKVETRMLRKAKIEFAKRTMEVASAMRQNFDRSQEIDSKKMAAITEKILKTPVTANVLAATIAYANMAKKPANLRKLEKAYPLAETWACLKEQGKGWGSTSFIARTTVEEAAAYFWDFTSKCHFEESCDLERKVIDESSTWHCTVMRRHRIEDGLRFHSSITAKNRYRTYVNRLFLEVVDEDTCLVLMKPVSKAELSLTDNGVKESPQTLKRETFVTHPTSGSPVIQAKGIDQPHSMKGLGHIHSRELASEKSAIKLTRISESKTKVEFVTEIDIGKVGDKGKKKIDI
jgi:hypothetical protein